MNEPHCQLRLVSVRQRRSGIRADSSKVTQNSSRFISALLLPDNNPRSGVSGVGETLEAIPNASSVAGFGEGSARSRSPASSERS